jgi:hypothetical protein
MREDWSQAEVEAIVADYFAMWDKDLHGQDYNKAEHNRQLLKIISKSRNRSSIEQKHRNISAVLWHLGYPYLRGYKPLPRYQKLLRDVVEERLVMTTDLNQIITTAVKSPTKTVPPLKNFKAVQVPPPQRKEIKELLKDESRRRTNFIRRNYLEEESKNRSLGTAGEEFILHYERERLWRAGKKTLADRIEHVAKTKGDYLGYDILSFEMNGRERLVEVKTTRYGALNRFFASASEVQVSESHKHEYHLHRVFNFDKQPQFFVLSGSLRDTCQLKPTIFSAVPN